MSIDFATLKGLEIPEGKVKSILITEPDGTAYEVGFAKPVRVNFLNGTYVEGGYHDGNYNYVSVPTDGIDGTWEGNVFIVPAGTELTLEARGTRNYYFEALIYGESYSVDNEITIPFTVTQSTIVELDVDYAEIGTFAINTKPWNASEGMTWIEWCDTNRFYSVDGNTVKHTTGKIVKYNGANVLPTDVIISGTNYALV